MNWYNLYKLASITFRANKIDQDPTSEMKDWFDKRTNRHIQLVQKYCDKIQEYDKRFDGLKTQAQKHDHSKFEHAEYEPYVYITWQYKCEDDEKEFDPSPDLKEKMSRATEHHVSTNKHHPEYHSSKKVDFINRENRDEPSKEMVNATSMPNLDLGEMVADWLAMSEEKGTEPKDWAKKNVNVRWKFTTDQVELIDELIENIWNGGIIHS